MQNYTHAHLIHLSHLAEMSSSISLVSKFFTSDQKHTAAVSLANLLRENSENAPLLADLLTQLEPVTIDAIYPQLMQYVNHTASSGNVDQFDVSVSFLQLVPTLNEEFFSSSLTELKRAIGSHLNFVTSFQKDAETYLADVDPNVEITKSQILNRLEFLSVLVSKSGSQISHDDFDKLLCLFLGHSDDEISSACSKVIRWRIDHLAHQCDSDSQLCDYLWKLIFGLIYSAASKKHYNNAYIMWLRMLNSTSSNLRNNKQFQCDYLNRQFYWEVLQNGLVSSSHEIRKFCLSILQLSVKSISTSFLTDIITWNMDQHQVLLKEWSRFTTLYEILGIDTSLHQTQAAVNDILALITPESLIHPSWGFCLLSTGFQASIDSVRKFSAHILLSIPSENLHLVQYGLCFLEDTYLPYMIQSRHFVVRTTENGSRELQCEYGDKFSQFLSQILLNLRTDEEFQQVSLSILKILEKNKEAYDGVRVYTALGLLKGLKGKKVLKFGLHDNLIIKLFDDFSEGELFSKTIQTLNLQLLLKFKLDNLSDFTSIVTKFIKFNGYQIFNEHLPSISQYLSETGFTTDDIINAIKSNTIPENEQIALFAIICNSPNADITSLESMVAAKSDLFISEMISSGVRIKGSFRSRVTKIWTDSICGILTADVYRNLCTTNLDFSEIFNKDDSLDNLYLSIVEDVKSSDYGILIHSVAKLKFFNRCACSFGLPSSIDLAGLLELHGTIFTQSSGCSKTVSDFYKLKEEAFGEYHQLVSIFVENNCGPSFDISPLLGVLHFGSTHHTTLLSICRVIYAGLESGCMDDETMQQGLVQLAESTIELDAERFKLADNDVHNFLIRIHCHPVVLESTIRNGILNELVSAFCEIFLFNANTRRGLFPPLAKEMMKFQMANPIEFEKMPFLPLFFVRAMMHRQVQHNAFKLEEIIGSIYDSVLNPVEKSNIYREIYGEDEVSSKVRIFAMLNSIKSPECARGILDAVFDKEDPFFFFNIIRSTDGVEEYTRSQLAKIVISVFDLVEIDYSFDNYFQHFFYFIENDPSPLVRVYFEWVIAAHLARKPERAPEVFSKLQSSISVHELRPTLVTIYERILFLMARSMDDENKTRYLTQLATIVLPAASTNKAVTRHFSMSLATSMYEEIRNNNIKVDKSVLSILSNMYESAVAQDAFGQYRSGNALLWDIVGDLTLVNISGGLLLRLNDRDVEYFTNEEFCKYLSKDEQARLNHPVGENNLNLWVKEIKASETRALQESNNIALSPLQTKSGAWSTVMDVDQSDRGSDIVRSDLIVVASLVDKAPNLGGICRLCDVLGAGLMTLHDLKVKNHPQFKSVAVTADYWMPMIEVVPGKIVQYLREKKAEGYTLIGLEQTDKSVVLDSDLKFPKKSLILLGREKEGVPGELLAELDICVEIKQVGVVRSMNIQTATAVIVHAYSSQNC